MMTLLLLFDYVMYWLYIFTLFAIMSRIFRKIPFKQSFNNKDVFAIGFLSFCIYLYFMYTGQQFVIDDWGWI